MAAPVIEKGYQTSGSQWWTQLADDEANPDLIWPRSVPVYDRMRREDPQVISVLRAVTLPIRRAWWAVDGTGCRPEVVAQIAEDLGLPIKGDPGTDRALRVKDRFSWPNHLRLALLELTFGHSFFEQVYRIDDQGQARLRKLGWRPPRTISDIKVADDGGLLGIEQYRRTGSADPLIGVDRLVAYVSDQEGGAWQGMSLLRGAYKFWLLKDRLLRVQAQTIDRNGLGVPVYTGIDAPEGISEEQWRELREQDLATGLELARGFRSGETAGAAIPHGASLALKGVEGKLPDAEPVIRYYDEQIARSVLAHFLNLGSETGSWALGSTFADFFVLSLQTQADHIADVANQHIIEDLVDLNWGESEPAPRLVHEEIGSRSPATAEAIYQLVSCGAIRMDDRTEAHLRTTYGLPQADPATTRTPGQAHDEEGAA